MRSPQARSRPRVAARFQIGAFAALVALSLAAASPAVTLDPDRLGPPLHGTGCFEGGNCAICVSSCDEADQNTANASVFTTALPSLHPFLHTAYSHVYTDFSVSPPAKGDGDWITATVYYDVEWKGLWILIGVLTGLNQASMTVDLALQDLADPSKIIFVRPVHETNPNGVGIDVADVGGWTDHDRAQGSFTTQLRRGHTYRITYRLDLRTLSFGNAYYALDYKTGGYGAWWNELRVALGPDPHELVADLGARVDTLEYRLEHHGHEYLTGRGVGQNNTVATTGAVVFFDDAGDSTGATNAVTENAEASPFSVILRSNYPNPARRSTTFAFTLSAPAQVTIRLFNAQGQLVSTLVDQWLEAGEQRIPFDVRSIAAGVYFYRLTAGTFTESRRLVVK
ncbi:MAG: T9SS type A sorting domain-containing protein [Hyphomicrobiales bacterium]